jgi:Fanconi anemia group J protein
MIRLRHHPSLQKGQEHDVWDIEDFVKLGYRTKGCPYFASRAIASESAEIVFCPYSYIIDPTIRSAMDIDLKDAIVIIDEAHNVEDVSREASTSKLSF